MPVRVFAPQVVSIYTRKRLTIKSGKEYWGFQPVTLGKGRKPAGPFFLRHTHTDGKQKWVSAGDNYTEATEHREKLLAAKGALRQGLPLDEADRATAEVLGGKTLKDAGEDFLKAKRHRCKPRSLQAYKATLDNFRECLSNRVRFTIDLTEAHVWQFVDCMKSQGLTAKTINTRAMYIRIFLNWLTEKKHTHTAIKVNGQNLPKVAKKKVESYSAGSLTKLKAAATDEERALIDFMLATGCREQEAQYAEWSDINFHERTHTVQKKEHHHFTPKSYESRIITLPTEVVDMLKDRKKHSKSALLFPSSTGRPDGHLLRILKAVALRAGLNCKDCKSKQDGEKVRSCVNAPVCRKHFLHRLRKTFATRMHHAGVPLRDLQGMLGHESLKTTEAYLAETERTDPRIRAAADKAFAL
jgi:integrase/recombinase XerD